MIWQRAINIARVFKKKKEEQEDDDAMSFVCIGLRRDSDASAVIDRVHVAANGIPEQTPVPDLPWESRHNGVPARQLRSVGHLSIAPVSNAETLDTRAIEVHVRAPQRASAALQPTQNRSAARNQTPPSRDFPSRSTEVHDAKALPDFSVSSSKRRPDRRLRSHRGSRIGEKSRVNVHEGNRLKLKEICAGYLFEPRSSEDEKRLELMFPAITPHTSKLNQEEANLLRLKQVREDFNFSEDDLIEELINDMEESMQSMALSENDKEGENVSSTDETVRESTHKTNTATQAEEKKKPESNEKVEKCPSPVPSLEFEPLFPVTDYQRRLREETRKALLLTEKRRQKTGSRE